MGHIEITKATAVGGRGYQEDRLLVESLPDGDLLAVFDGHGGEECSDYLSKHFSGAFQTADKDRSLLQYKRLIPALFRKVFKQMAEETKLMYAGSTASVVWLPRGTKVIFVAVIGDSPVIIGRKRGFHLSPEHNARTNLKERKAAEDRGAYYFNGYLMGRGWNSLGLQMSRAMGDRELGFVSHVPQLYSLPRHDFVLVATDGCFDPSHKDGHVPVAEVVNSIRTTGTTAQDVVDRAVRIRTGDNATAILWKETNG